MFVYLASGFLTYSLPRAAKGGFMLQSLESRLLFATAAQVGGILTITGDGTAEDITVDKSGSNVVITGDITGTSSFSGTTKVIAWMGDGNDDVIITTNITFGTELHGEDGNDSLRAGNGNDTIHGGGDDDQIAGRTGTDDMEGDSGNDTVVYTSYTGNINVSLDGVDNDGLSGENDGVEQFENIEGGTGNDTLTGDGNRNFLYGDSGDDSIRGGGGNDDLVGVAGNDTLKGEDGDDFLFAQFSDVDTVIGGSGIDSGTTDAIDVVTW
jgi:Ca2+-binding RTX toxin-like protein